MDHIEQFGLMKKEEVKIIDQTKLPFYLEKFH